MTEASFCIYNRLVFMDISFATLQTYSDEALSALARAGNSEAEELLVTRYGRLVRAVSHSLYLVGGDSDDLCQEGMIGLLRAIRTYRSDRNALFSTYAELCVRHRLQSVLRSANSNKQSALNSSVSFDPSLFEGDYFSSDTASPSHENPELLMIDRERVDALYVAIREKLSDFEVKVLSFYLDGYSCREIADLTNRAYKSVDNAVQRIRRKIVRHLLGESSNR